MSVPPGIFVTEHRPDPQSSESGDLIVLLVHGSMDRQAGFARVRRELTDLHLVSYDRRGYGRSLRAQPPTYTLAQHVSDLLEIVDGRPWIGVGHSYGADIVLAAASMNPVSLRGVVAYEPPTPWYSWWPRKSQFEEPPDVDDPGIAAEEFIRKIAGNQAWDKLPEKSKEQRRAEGTAFMTEVNELYSDPRLFDPARITVPVLLGQGTLSAPYRHRAVEELAGLIDGAEVMTLEGASHNGHMSDPRGFALMVRKILARSS